ncbi:MAG TPA: beta-propeller fold lactonase family protein [Solirubrobacterales bacterium]|nr:beta-propeller fold lactonase family protein [Solirubrobacterales bacterium]
MIGRSVLRIGVALAILALAALAPAVAVAAAGGGGKPRPASAPGTLTQLPGKLGCLMDNSSRGRQGCGPARALKGPGPFMGSRAIAVSPDGRNVYVASSGSDAVAIFQRNPRNGALLQQPGTGGCVADGGASGCAEAVGLDAPNSIAISGDGASVYVTSRASNSLTAFHRNPKTGALRQLPGAFGCVSGLPLPGCAAGRALLAPDVVVVSRDGKNVYAGSFLGNAVAVFARDPASGAIAQPGGSGGCIAEAIAGCAPAIALGAPEGMAVSANGNNVYVAGAASSSIAVLQRDPATGALAQATDGGGCVADAPLSGCATGFQLSGANALALSPNGKDLYATALFDDSVASFSRGSTGTIAQKEKSAGCLVYLRSVGCSFGRALVAPEGIDVAPDGANLYVASFRGGALDVLGRTREGGAVAQLPNAAGCLAPRSLPGCTPARALRGVGSVAVSPDGRNVYSTAFGSNAVDVFRRNG